jgi:hypothetical protein
MRLRSIVAGRKPVFNDQGEQIGETWAASDRDAVQAAKLLTQYGFEGGAGLDGPVFATHAVVRPEIREPEGEESVAALRQQAVAMIEETLQAVNTRTKRRGKRI